MRTIEGRRSEACDGPPRKKVVPLLLLMMLLLPMLLGTLFWLV